MRKKTACGSLFFLWILCHCEKPTVPSQEPYSYLHAEVEKWSGRQAAVSITYDAYWGDKVRPVAEAVLGRHLRMDFEIVTAWFDKPSCALARQEMRDFLIPSGIHFFGHGHEHIDHDALTEDSAYASFRRCYELMAEWGLNPKAYAYPGGRGHLEKTQRANRDAGFLGARGAVEEEDRFFICAGDTVEPENTYYLPAVPISDHQSDRHIHNHQEMTRILDRALNRRAWIILMYHSIGLPEGYNYYPMAEFLQDIDSIAEQDFWCGNMDEILCYIRERNTFRLEQRALSLKRGGAVFKVAFVDSLENVTYDQPLDVILSVTTGYRYTACTVDPPVMGISRFTLDRNTMRLRVIPDEMEYRLTFH